MRLRSILTSLCVTLSAGVATAQTYPARPVTMIVVFAAGGPTDIMARIAGEHMGRTLGQQFVIENVAGAGGTTGGTRGAKAAADGYTLTVGSLGSHAAAPALYKSVGYDPRELDTIGLIAGTPSYLVVRKEFPARTFAEFLALARQNPNKLTNGHAGVGSTPHLSCLLLASLTGLKVSQVPYRGSGPAMNDLVAGQIDSMCDLAPTVVPQIQAGTIRGLLVGLPERALTTPDVPTAREAGVPDYLFSGWNAIFTPKGTAKEAVDKLSGALLAALNDPAVRKRIEDLGSVPAKPAEATPDALRKLVASDVDKWKRVIAEAGVEAQ